MIYLTTILLIFALLAGWLLVQAATRRFARHHPEFEVAHEEGCGGCSHNCGAQRNSD
jgi:threonine/homoserine/homoserine lactone efflux protein